MRKESLVQERRSGNEKWKSRLLVLLLIALIPAAGYRVQSLRQKTADHIVVFCYHRLCTDEYHQTITKEKDLWTKKSDFEAEMKWLHDRGYRTLSLDEFYAWHEGKKELPPKSVVITFDDGYQNVIEHGLPIMKKYNIKATMFMIGVMMTETQEDEGELDYIGRDTMQRVQEEYPNFAFQSHSYDLHHDSNRNAVIFKKTDKEIMEDMANQEKQLKGADLKYLAYPYGYGTAGYMKALRAYGFRLGFTYDNKVAARRSDSAYRIPRVGVRGDLPVELAFCRWLESSDEGEKK